MSNAPAGRIHPTSWLARFRAILTARFLVLLVIYVVAGVATVLAYSQIEKSITKKANTIAALKVQIAARHSDITNLERQVTEISKERDQVRGDLGAAKVRIGKICVATHDLEKIIKDMSSDEREELFADGRLLNMQEVQSTLACP